MILAYEPVWAIGTGKSASVEDVQAMHGFIRKKLQEKLLKMRKLLCLISILLSFANENKSCTLYRGSSEFIENENQFG